ncbi:hypothetical protein V1506DRAFT_460280, partial [Lipomyces tetrasporus]
VACVPFHHQSAIRRQLLWQLFGTLHMPKKGVLPTAARPVLAMDDNALLKALFARAVPDLKKLLVILVPSCSGIKCLQEVIHRCIPDIIGSLLEPGLFERLCRLVVDCPGSQRLLRSRDSLILYGAQTFVVRPPRCPHPVEQISFSAPPWGTVLFFAPSAQPPFLISAFWPAFPQHTGRPPETCPPTTCSCLLAPVFGLIRRRRRQPHLLAYTSRNTVPEGYRETLLLLLLFCLLQIHGGIMFERRREGRLRD